MDRSRTAEDLVKMLLHGMSDALTKTMPPQTEQGMQTNLNINCFYSSRLDTSLDSGTLLHSFEGVWL